MKAFSEEWLRDKGYEKQPNGEYKKTIYEGNTSDGEHKPGDTGIQKRKAHKQVRKVVHRSKSKSENTGVGEAIIVVNFRVSDRNRRDMDNMLSTVLDSIVRLGLIPDDSICEVGRTIITSEISDQPGFDLLIIK